MGNFFGGLFIFVVLFMAGLSVVMTTKMIAAKAECELTLPRYQTCKVVAVPREEE